MGSAAQRIGRRGRGAGVRGGHLICRPALDPLQHPDLAVRRVPHPFEFLDRPSQVAHAEDAHQQSVRDEHVALRRAAHGRHVLPCSRRLFSCIFWYINTPRYKGQSLTNKRSRSTCE